MTNVHLPKTLDCVFTPSILHCVQNLDSKDTLWAVRPFSFDLSTQHHSRFEIPYDAIQSLTHKLIFRGGQDRISRIIPYTGSPPDGMNETLSSFPVKQYKDTQVWCPSETGGIDTDSFYIEFEDESVEKDRRLYVEAYFIILSNNDQKLFKKLLHPDGMIKIISSEGATFSYDDTLGVAIDQRAEMAPDVIKE